MKFLEWIFYISYIPSTFTAPSQRPNSSLTHDSPFEVDVDINSKSRKAEILEKILNASTYDPTIRPKAITGSGPLDVVIGIHLQSVENVDDEKMEYSIQMIFWQEWLDPRLNYSQLQNDVDYLQLPDSKSIWLPDVYFLNEKSGYLHDLMVPNMYTRLHPDGRILQSYRITLVLSCKMNLRAYPLDIQTCPVRLGSYGWTTKDLVVDWKSENPVVFADDFNTPRFRVKEIHPSRCTDKTQKGTYSCLVLEMKFQRDFGFYLIQIYIPCTMLVIVSWVSFWLEPQGVEARVSLGVTTILTIVTQTYGINLSAPPASYAKALDVWTSWCQGMVFGALLEFSAVNYLCSGWLHKAKKQLIKKMDKEEMEKKHEKLQAEALGKAKRVDTWARILFPGAFLIFNVFYWCYYLLIID